MPKCNDYKALCIDKNQFIAILFNEILDHYNTLILLFCTTH